MVSKEGKERALCGMKYDNLFKIKVKNLQHKKFCDDHQGIGKKLVDLKQGFPSK